MKILIIRLSSIGDILLTTPVLDAFKKKYPDSKIDFLVMSQFKDAIFGNKNINELILFDKYKNNSILKIKEFADSIKINKYDIVFDLHSKFRSKLIAKTIGVKTYTYKKRKWWKSILVDLRLIRYKVDDSIIKNYFGAFKEFDIKYTGEKLTFDYSEKDKENIKEYKYLPVIAPGASKNTKKWTKEGFTKLVGLLYDKYGKKVVLVGGKEDIEECHEIGSEFPDKVIDLSGKLTLKETGALLAQSMFLVCNDSAPFHIARGVGIDAFVVFGPTSPGMFEFGPKDHLIYANEKCSPCSLHGDKKCAKGHFKCMKNITAEDILKNITEIWESKNG